MIFLNFWFTLNVKLMIIISGGKIFVNLRKCEMGQTFYKNQQEGHMSSQEKDWDKSSELPPHFSISVITPLVESIWPPQFSFAIISLCIKIISPSYYQFLPWFECVFWSFWLRNLVRAPEGVGQLSQAWLLVREHIWPPSLSPSIWWLSSCYDTAREFFPDVALLS